MHRIFIAAIMLLGLALSLCACGEQERLITPTPSGQQNTATNAPSDTPTPTVTPTPTPSPTPTPIPNWQKTEWWLEHSGSDDVIMTYSEIRAKNKSNATMATLRLLNLSTVKPYTANQVAGLIKDFAFPTNREYIDGRKVESSDKTNLNGNRNLNALTKLNQRYAVTVVNASIKGLPSSSRVTNEDGLYDYLQNSGENIGEPLIVLHESLDGEWFFVRATDCFGWVLKTSVALCSRAEFDKICDSFYNGKVLCATESGEYTFMPYEEGGSKGEKKQYIRLGTYFPYNAEHETITIPSRTAEGTAVFTEYKIPNDKISPLLPFTTRNVLKLAFSLLGMPYSWGDENEMGMDCSSTIKSIYKCFGFILPRNSSQQRILLFDRKEFKDLDSEGKKDYIRQQAAGTILYMPGHVMLLLGECDGEPYILHTTTTIAKDEGEPDSVQSCLITDIDVGATGKTYLDRIVTTINITTK